MSDNWLDEYREGLFSGKIPMENPKIRKPGDPKYYYFDPRGMDKHAPLKEWKLIGVPTADTPNPALAEMNKQRKQEQKYVDNFLMGSQQIPASFKNEIKNLSNSTKYTLNDFPKEKFNEVNPVLTNNLVNKYQGYHNHLSESERQDAFRTGKKIRLKMKPNPDFNEDIWPINYAIPLLGRYTVNKYNDTIEKYAQKYNLDSNLVRAVMYAESATGHKFGLDKTSDEIEKSPLGPFYKYIKEDIMERISSQQPMNVQGRTWSDIDNRQFNPYDPEQNIEMATILLKRISDSLDQPLPSSVGTLYNNTGANQVNRMGFRVGDAYNRKLWEK